MRNDYFGAKINRVARLSVFILLFFSQLQILVDRSWWNYEPVQIRKEKIIRKTAYAPSWYLFLFASANLFH